MQERELTMGSTELNIRLPNKRVVITGAAGLLGKQYASVLARSGATLELIDIDNINLKTLESELRREYSIQKINASALDITDEKRVSTFSEKLISSLQTHEELVLINNAAIDAKVGSDKKENLSRLEHFNLDQWQKEISVGLTGAFLFSKYLGAAMAKRESGIILNVASDLGIIAPNQELYKNAQLPDCDQSVKPVTYSVIKHGIIGLTKYLATYWPKQGVRCNAIAPGGVQTQQPEEFVERVSALIPQGRMATVDEYNGALQFLLSDAARYMNGHVLVMDGGRTIW